MSLWVLENASLCFRKDFIYIFYDAVEFLD